MERRNSFIGLVPILVSGIKDQYLWYCQKGHCLPSYQNGRECHGGQPRDVTLLCRDNAWAPPLALLTVQGGWRLFFPGVGA